MEGRLEVLHRVARSTVTVAARISEDNPSAAVLGTSRYGSGTVIDRAGHVLTVNYVVLGANDVSVVDIEGNTHPAAIVAQDFATGVAVVRMTGGNVPALPAAPLSAIEAGEDVFMVASVGNRERRSASGAVSALDAFDAYWEYRLDRAIWTTCANPGLGGAPVCTRRGELVGVVSLNLGNVGRTTLAIPADNFFLHSTELLTHGRRVTRRKRAWLGMFCYALPDQTVVAGLLPGGPGADSGLEPGDVVLSVDGERVCSRADFYQRIWTHDPGEIVEIEVFRDGDVLEIGVTSADVEEFFA